MPAHSPTVGCFGKLPLYGDYIEHHANGAEVRGLHQWFQNGLAALPAGTEPAYDRGPAYSFLFPAEKAEKLLAGHFAFSRDQVGRKYPFMIFALFARESVGAALSLIPAALASFLSQAHHLATSGWQGLTKSQVLAQVDQLQTAIPLAWEPFQKKFADYLSSEKAEQFWTDLLGRFEDKRKYLMVQNLLNALTPLRHGRFRQCAFGLKFPLSNSASAVHEILLWMELIARRLESPADFAPIIFWNHAQGETPAGLLIFFRPPGAGIVPSLLNPAVESEVIFRLHEEGASQLEKIVDKMSENHKRILEAPELALGEWLKQM